MFTQVIFRGFIPTCEEQRKRVGAGWGGGHWAVIRPEGAMRPSSSHGALVKSQLMHVNTNASISHKHV